MDIYLAGSLSILAVSFIVFAVAVYRDGGKND